MAKYDDALGRMAYLMEFKNTNGKTSNNIEFTANGADGKVYGILKEGTKYYIKTTVPGKEQISESYEYINGFNYRRENEYSSYNEASKQLELTLMSLNEAYGKKNPTSTVDFNRTEKAFANLTLEAREELDRMHMIFENSCKIGKPDCICDPESKGEAKAEDTEENNDPFSKLASVTNKGGELNVTPKTDGDEMKDVSKEAEKNLTSDKDPKAEDTTKNDYEPAHSDLEGESVAEKKVNEGIDTVNIAGQPEVEDELNPEEFEGVDDEASIEDLVSSFEDNAEEEAEEEEEEDDLDALLEAVEIEVRKEVEDEPKTVSVEQSLENPTDDTMKSFKAEKTTETESEENLKSFDAKGSLPVQSVEKITEAVYEKVLGMVAEKKLKEKIDKMVNEEIANLGIFGKHPGFRKEPMTTPTPDKATDSSVEDVEAKTASEDKPFASKIGDGKPFSEKVINILTDQVMAQLKEALKK